MNTGFFHKRIFHGVLYFFFLAAFAMIQSAPAVMLLILLLPAFICLTDTFPECKTGYLAVVLAVCKNE